VAPGNEVEGAGQDGDRTGHEGEPPSYEVEGTDQDSSDCAQDPAIPDGGDVFVGQAFGDAGIVWSASNIVISHG
jgi:hypothetical protein